MKTFDLIVVGGGAAGMTAAIKAAREGKNVVLLEKLPELAVKLKATGGGRCNLTNTLSSEEFMQRFGKNGRFMQDALNFFGKEELRDFLDSIEIPTHIPDGFRVFPIGHDSQTVLRGFLQELKRLNIHVIPSQRAEKILHENDRVSGVKTQDDIYFAPNVIIATGGLGYPTLGAEGDGYVLAKELGHSVTELYPAMMPLFTKETWVESCRADTIPKAKMHVDIKKYKNLKAVGDLIFTKEGIRGPVVLDFAREITPLLHKLGEVPVLVNLIGGKNEEEILQHFKQETSHNPHDDIQANLDDLLPESVIYALCSLIEINPSDKFNKIEGKKRAELLKVLAATPLTITGHEGFKKAMITRGGISLKEIDPRTMQSKLIQGLYFCGEVVDIDGPCGGYNLQWSFSSGYLAGSLFS